MSERAATLDEDHGARGGGRVRRLLRSIPRPSDRRSVLRLVALGLALAGLFWLWHSIGLEELIDRAQALPAVGVIIALSLLPLIGFPVSWLHLIAGVRFGFVGGIATVAWAGLCHHFLGWLLVRVLPRRCFRRLDHWREKLVGAGHRDATLLCGLLPGMPYAVQLYVLPAIGTPLWMLLGLSTALHTGRALVTILLGDHGDELTPARLALLAGYYAVLLSVSYLALQRLRKAIAMKSKDPRPAPEQISARARHLWQLNGSPPGRDDDFRRQAESELRQEMRQVDEQSRGLGSPGKPARP
ncbi:MAG: DUF2934 domain-containing protein [Verrucomicrobiota bacterium]